MKVLLLTQVLPYPPISGPSIKTWNVLKYLTQKHDVTLVSFARGDQSEEIETLKRHCIAVHTVPMARHPLYDAAAMIRSLLTGQPWMMVRDDRAAMRKTIDACCAETRFDIVHADQLNMAQYAARVPGARKILDAHNALWLLYKRQSEMMEPGIRRMIFRRDWRLLKKYEGRICREFDGILTVSENDQSALEEAAGTPKKMVIVPIAVDTDELPMVPFRPESDHILHIGTMFWPPNVDGIAWFLEEIFPILQAEQPEIVVDLVGSRPPKKLMDLGLRDPRINVTGYVKDVQPYLEQAGVYVVPLKAGGGMRVKILETLSRGIPMVTTTIGCEGIAVTHEKDILIADKPADFAAAVLKLLSDRQYARNLSLNGRKLAESTYDYRTACSQIDQVYQPRVNLNYS